MKTNPGTAFITGASAGIGKAFARRLASEGYNLILHGRREPQLNSLCEELHSQHGITAEYVIAELSNPIDLHALEERMRTIPDLTLLVNNAGFGTIQSFENEDIGRLDAMIQTHITAPVRLMHAVLPRMLDRRQGAIINVSSVAGFLVSPGSLYCATKAATDKPVGVVGSSSPRQRRAGSGPLSGLTRSEFHQRMGVDTSGDFFKNFMSAEQVVDASLRALKRGKVVCIPGLRYKLAVLAPRFLPKKVIYGLGYVYRRIRGTERWRVKTNGGL